jgi:hypothetical protein
MARLSETGGWLSCWQAVVVQQKDDATVYNKGRKIRLIVSNVKCRHLKNVTCK